MSVSRQVTLWASSFHFGCRTSSFVSGVFRVGRSSTKPTSGRKSASPSVETPREPGGWHHVSARHRDSTHGHTSEALVSGLTAEHSWRPQPRRRRFRRPREALAAGPRVRCDLPIYRARCSRRSDSLRPSTTNTGSWSTPREPYLPRYDLLGKVADPKRTSTRRSLIYVGHLTDIHIDRRAIPRALGRYGLPECQPRAGVIRPQDTMQMNVLAQMTLAMNAARVLAVDWGAHGGCG